MAAKLLSKSLLIATSMSSTTYFIHIKYVALLATKGQVSGFNKVEWDGGRKEWQGPRTCYSFCQPNILTYHSQHGTYAEILLQRKLRKMSHTLQRNNGWCIATLHLPRVQAKPTEFKGEDKSVRNPFPGCSSICPDLICHRWQISRQDQSAQHTAHQEWLQQMVAEMFAVVGSTYKF